MYDNANNNQNFNNTNTMFDGFQNNITSNNELNKSSQMINIEQNNNFMQPWQLQNNIQPQQLFGNSEFSVTNTNQLEENDIPPNLGDIKNLSEATISSAPTMDVLGPMNIMPETLPKPSDPLEAYEKGDLNIGSSLDMKDSTTSHPSSAVSQASMIHSDFMSDVTNQGINNFNNNLTTTNSVDDFNQDIQPNIPNIQNNFIKQYQSYNPSSEYQPVSSTSSFTNQQYQLDQLQNANTTLDSNYMKNNPEKQNINFSQEQLSNKLQEEDKNSIEIPETKEVSDINSAEVQSISNQTKQEIEESSSFNKATNLSDLGLDESYTEPDMLEIMDLDNDSEPTNVETKDVDLKVSNNLVSDNVEKIKSFIEELKNSGAQIEVEEFDFETMYQLIVKLNK